MKRFSTQKFIAVSILAILTVSIVSIREVHYLISNHHENDHCENHLHAADTHVHCNVCKFDVSLFTDKIVDVYFVPQQVHTSIIAIPPLQFIPNCEVLANSLRGPPKTA